MTSIYRFAAVAAFILGVPALTAPAAIADPARSFVIAQAAESQDILIARQNLLVAEQALLEAKANGGDIKAARRAVRRARRDLEDLLAAAGASSNDATASENTQPTDKARKKARKRKQREAEAAERARAEAQAQAEAEAQAQAEAEARARAEAEAAARAAAEAAAKAEAKAAKKARRAARKAAKAAAEAEARAAAQAAAEAAAKAAEEAAAEQAAEETGIKGETVDPRVKKLRRKLRAARRQNQELREQIDTPEGAKVVGTNKGRTILRDKSGRVFIHREENEDRALRGANDVKVERLRNGRTRTTIYRENGSQIVTLRDRHGDIIVRFRRDRKGREHILVDNRIRPDRRPRVNIEVNLPKVLFNTPPRTRVVDLNRQTRREDVYEALAAPPVAKIDQPYTLDEILYNHQVRDLTWRIDLDAITFDTGSALIAPSQIPALSRLAYAIGEVLIRTPGALILIEGHTDAVGSETYNLILSAQRAESVAIVLSESFGVPPENLVTQGYGEAYLKVPTLHAERRNRRVTARNLYGLMQTSQY